MKAIIMAGGLGTRASSIDSSIPKPMILVDGIPILEREIQCLQKQGFTDLIITVGHLSQKIIEYFGDGSGISPKTGLPFGVHIEYLIEDRPLGNAGALLQIADKINEDFLLLNGDIAFDVDLSRFVNFHRSNKSLASIIIHPNDHPQDSSLVITDKNNRVIDWISTKEKRPVYFKNSVNAGIHILNPKIFSEYIKKNELDINLNNNRKVNLDNEILKPLINSGDLYAYETTEYIKDMGTPERFLQVELDYKSGKVFKRNLTRKQKAIFLDRDGTLNNLAGFITKPEQLVLLPGVGQAIKQLNKTEYLAVVITNQPVIARGEVTVQGLNKIHNKLETELGKCGAFVDRIYYCPHHPDKGYIGEVSELKVKCECRKPRPGLLYKASFDLNIDLKNSWMIGDSEADILAGKNAGTKTALIGTGNYGQDISVNSLEDFIRYLINRGE